MGVFINYHNPLSERDWCSHSALWAKLLCALGKCFSLILPSLAVHRCEWCLVICLCVSARERGGLSKPI